MKIKPIKKMKIMYPCEITDSNGKYRAWTENDLREIANNYSFSSPEKAAPILLSHETKGKPRYGYIDKLWVENDKGTQCLYCSAQVSEKLEYEMYPNRSVSVFPESKKINHLALLGAEQPAFEDLGPAEYSEASQSAETPSEFTIWIENGDIQGALNTKITEIENRLNTELTEIKTLLNNISANFRDNPVQKKEKEENKADFSKPAKSAEVSADFAKIVQILKEPLAASAPAVEEETSDNAVVNLSDKAYAYIKKQKENGVVIDFKTAISKLKGKE